MAKREVLQMSQKEVDRLKIIHEVLERKLKQKEAARLLKLTPRHINRIVKRVKKEGHKGVVHRLRGCPSNRRIPQELKEKAIYIIKERYSDFGPTLASEKLLAWGIKVSNEKIRQWMTEKGLWHPERRKPFHRKSRERKHSFGEMVLLDGSHHDWFEGRRAKCVLLATIDDATNRVFLRFEQHEGTK